MQLRPLSFSLVATALACVAPPAVAAVQKAVVERTADEIRLSWIAAPGEAVDVFVAERPDAPLAQMRLLAEDDRDGVFHRPNAPTAREYFLLRAEDGRTVRAAERGVPLAGARNFRDLGGYRTADGRRVRWGLIYRSGELSGLTREDGAALDQLGIDTIYDLRSTGERNSAPTRWTGGQPPQILSRDYDMDLRPFATAFADGVDETRARAALAQLYPQMLESHAPQFREIFLELLGEPGPILYHCSAGKDRTGVATALILAALGVPRETIVADYLLSNRRHVLAPQPVSVQPAASPEMRIFASLPPEVMKTLMTVEAEYLTAVFAEIDHRYGGMESYLDNELDIGPEQLRQLRERYLE